MSDDAVRVGILDTGLLPDALAAPCTVANFSAGMALNEPHGHGMQMAEIVLGHAPGVSLLGAQVFAEGRPARVDSVVDGLYWLIEQGASVVNMSLGLHAERESLRHAVDAAVAAGVVLVASSPAAGKPVYPAAWPGVLAVSGDARCAPGEWALYHDRLAEIGACPGGHQHQPHQAGGGASFAAAHVSGLVAVQLANGDSATQALARLREQARFSGPERRQ